MSARGGSQLRRGEQSAQELTEQREREHNAVQLALAGASYDAIAQQCGYESRSGAWKAVHRLLARVEAEDAEAIRTVEGARLDRLQTAHWPAAVRGDVKASSFVLRVMERRARLFGLDAPVQVDATVRDATTAEIARLAEELGITPGPVIHR